MGNIPGMPGKSQLPIDTVFNLAGFKVASQWMGGVHAEFFDEFDQVRYGFALKDWWQFKEHYFNYDPDYKYVCAPETAVDIRSLATAMISGGWKIYSPYGYNNAGRMPINFPLTQDPFPFVGGSWPYMRPSARDPWMQHYVLSTITKTLTGNGYAPIWLGGNPESITTIAAQHWNTIALVIDGSGSFFGRGWNHIRDLLSAVNSDARVIATKFSDYTDPSNFTADADDIPALLLGTWDHADLGVANAIVTADQNNDTGSGGDVNESQFEAIKLAMKTAIAQGWHHGNLALVVYTDAASVCPFNFGSNSAVRLNQRDDGGGVKGHARLNTAGYVGNRPTSVQQHHAPRLPQGPNTYA